MDVPFLSSSALSRSHYSLVRKVEHARSPQAVDQILFAQIDFIRDRLRQPSLSSKQCKECLVILLYCVMTMTTSAADLDLSFALSHAINLAEAGISVQDKRIGYLFCTEMMPPEHPLQLLLVNTLRKDLESSSIPQVCLALDAMIQSPFEDLIPAVQTRLYDMISHNSVHIRRRTLLALRALSREQPGLIKPAISKIQKRLQDSEPAVASAALTVILDLVNSSLLSAETLSMELNDLLRHCWKFRADASYISLMTRTLKTLRLLRPISENSKIYTDIVCFSSQPRVIFPALLIESVLSLSASSVTDVVSPPYDSPVNYIRHLLTSENPNERYLFLYILESLEPRIWAGTVPEIPAVLEAWEVERIMQLLDSQDKLIRAKTLGILRQVDSSIVESYFTRMLDSQSVAVGVDAQTEYAMRLVQVVEVLCADDGEVYARCLKQVLLGLESGNQENRHVFHPVVEEVLVYIRQARTTFRIASTTALLTSVTEQDLEIGPTFMVISAALACENSNVTSIPPSDLLRGLADRLPTCPASVKEACLLAMMRVAADCEDIPNIITEKVNKTSEVSGRYLRRRYDQFSSLVSQRSVLNSITSRAKSSSLPDFVIALELHYSMQNEPNSSIRPTQSPSPSPNMSQLPTLPGSRLRYAAYETPRPTSRLSTRPSQKRGSGSVSDAGSSRLSVDSRRSEDPMSKTVTAGELALMAGDSELAVIAQSSPKPHSHQKPLLPTLNTAEDMSDITSRVDLIAFDSPFISEPANEPENNESVLEIPFNFEVMWNTLEQSNSRGWCEMTMDSVVRRLQTLQFKLHVIPADQNPFQGDLKVIASQGESSVALLRLRESDDDESCLWRLRCDDEQLRVGIRRSLAD